MIKVFAGFFLWYMVPNIIENHCVRAHFNLVGSDWRSNSLFTCVFYPKTASHFFGKRSNGLIP